MEHTQMKWRRVERNLRVGEGKAGRGLSLQPEFNKGAAIGILRAEQHWIESSISLESLSPLSLS